MTPPMSCDVSVIIPLYNSSDMLRRALDSVYDQSLLPLEIIVVDDGSADWEQSRLIAASYPDSISIRFIHMDKNQGVSAARNIGVAAALCRYLAFLDSDDVWYREKIAIQYGLMTGCNLDVSAHEYVEDMKRIRYDSNDSHERPSLFLSLLSSWSCLLRNYATPTVMVLRQKMVLFDPGCPHRCEDWKCWMELLSKHGCRGVHIGRVLAGGFKRSIGVSGLSQDVKAMHAGRMLALKRLVDGGNISMVQYLVGLGVETVKYLIRILRVRFRRHASRHRQGL
jgi:glycosyltransferase involved in cell wall biosynthesis